jgi:hypothetical protein
LQQPCRRTLRQHLDEVFLVRPSNQLIDGLEDRIVRLLAAKPFHALASRDPNLRRLTDALHEQVDKRRLPDTGLSRQENHLARPASGLV